MPKLFVTTILLLVLVLSHRDLHASVTDPQKDSLITRDSVRDTVFFPAGFHEQAPPETFRRKKLITCIMAFPLPFGFVGMHRIYLGSEPWVPIVYLCTAGGGCGLLPLIDFLYLVTANEEEFKKYENNPKVFMFVE
jgi:TM2 domain-containing membrane protein YozV